MLDHSIDFLQFLLFLPSLLKLQFACLKLLSCFRFVFPKLGSHILFACYLLCICWGFQLHLYVQLLFLSIPVCFVGKLYQFSKVLCLALLKSKLSQPISYTNCAFQCAIFWIPTQSYQVQFEQLESQLLLRQALAVSWTLIQSNFESEAEVLWFLSRLLFNTSQESNDLPPFALLQEPTIQALLDSSSFQAWICPSFRSPWRSCFGYYSACLRDPQRFGLTFWGHLWTCQFADQLFAWCVLQSQFSCFVDLPFSKHHPIRIKLTWDGLEELWVFLDAPQFQYWANG